MSSDDLKAWLLLLAGFKYKPEALGGGNTEPEAHRYMRVWEYADYTLAFVSVKILPLGVISVTHSPNVTKQFTSFTEAQQYIQLLIGDRHADIPSDHCTGP